MPWDDDRSPDALKKALNERRFTDAEKATAEMLAELADMPRQVPAQTAKKVLSILKSYARFDQMLDVAQAFKACGTTSPEVLNLLAQARIEKGQMTTAIGELKKLRHDLENELEQGQLTPLDKKRLQQELSETLGLLGRSYKQLYINANPTANEPRKCDLDEAIKYYEYAYNQLFGDYLWHGVNYIALLTHAKRISKSNSMVYSKAAGKHAQSILDAIERIDSPQPWDKANLIEAYLACGKTPEAVKAAREYLDSEGLTAFNIQSTQRQLIQLWMLCEEKKPGQLILPMMTARYAELGGGSTQIELKPQMLSGLEAVWGETGYQSIDWLRKALNRAQSVARLGSSAYEEGRGTGFLFDGGCISDEYAKKTLLLTNAHVCSDDAQVQRQYPYPKPSGQTTAFFLGSIDPDQKIRAMERKVIRQIWTSSPMEFDATLLELECPPESTQQPLTPGDTMPEKDERVNIIGHPRGLGLKVSLQDNLVVSRKDKLLHYRTPTDNGSSGSPVFNQNWELVALHHAASTEAQANEGILINRIVEKMKQDLLK
ncbi:MAG: trypsin-like peptidase domain-containing protein [Deltaproteobacteria bacterium]|nr:trypsin-like peptidase domain-containing protein [Deltaproteobacteria bacterium]